MKIIYLNKRRGFKLNNVIVELEGYKFMLFQIYFIFLFLFIIIFINKLMKFNNFESDKLKNIQSDKMKTVFSDIYKYNKWLKGSGYGSTKECTKEYLNFLQMVINKYNIKSIVDYGCGDWQMLSNYVFNSSQTYYGYDLVESVIERNKRKYERGNTNFYILKDINDIKMNKDLIMIKDVLQHWNNENIIYFLKNIIPKYKYALIVNYYNNNITNSDTTIGAFRSINLESSPYNLLSFKWKKDIFFCNEWKRIYFHSSQM